MQTFKIQKYKDYKLYEQLYNNTQVGRLALTTEVGTRKRYCWNQRLLGTPQKQNLMGVITIDVGRAAHEQKLQDSVTWIILEWFCICKFTSQSNLCFLLEILRKVYLLNQWKKKITSNFTSSVSYTPFRNNIPGLRFLGLPCSLAPVHLASQIAVEPEICKAQCPKS